MAIRTTYSKSEIIETVTQNLDQCDDPKWIAKMATKICGPKITWNEDSEQYEEHED